MCVFIALKGHSFYNLFIFVRMQGLAKLSSLLICKEMMGEEIFQLHAATVPPTSVCYMSYVFLQGQKRDKFNKSFFPYWCTTEFSLPAGVQNGLLSLLLQISYFETLPWHQTKWLLVIKHMHWVDNHQMIITAKYGSHHFTGYEENAI